MDAGLLKQLFGPARGWNGPCVVLVDAETSVKTTGPDSIVTGGVKTYAPSSSGSRPNTAPARTSSFKRLSPSTSATLSAWSSRASNTWPTSD